MPSSNPFAISKILREVLDLRPKSILDIGPGFGKWGVLFREFLDVWNWNVFPPEWKVRIDCIEAYPKYVSPLHEYVYNKVIVQDVRTISWADFPPYELICLFDVIEHMDKLEGYDLLHVLVQKAIKAVFVSTPLPEDFSPSPHGRWEDDFEGHKEAWSPLEFVENFGAEIVMCDGGKSGCRTFLAKIKGVRP